MEFDELEEVNAETIARRCDRLGLPNIAVLLFEKPIDYRENEKTELPTSIRLMCSVRDGELRVISPERRLCPLSGILERTELPKSNGFAAIPVFYGSRIYGMLLASLNDESANRGELVADQLGRTLRLNDKT